jgi:hypothetical protein
VGTRKQAMKTMRQLYGGVEGYDFEEEYGIIAKTIEHERESARGSTEVYVTSSRVLTW